MNKRTESDEPLIVDRHVIDTYLSANKLTVNNVNWKVVQT